MRYLGGKSKIARALAGVIGKGETLIEPFCGGGAMTAALAPQFVRVEASDTHEDLILLWKAIQAGWQPPREISEQEYARLKLCAPSALRGFAGFAGASWGGKWFGGYARGGGRNYADEAARSLARDVEKISNVTFYHRDYINIKPQPGDVVYADPPYAGTTGYGKPFSSEEFWEVMNYWTILGALVFVSEYKAPDNWACVWEQERTRDMKADTKTAVKVTEKLFFKSLW